MEFEKRGGNGGGGNQSEMSRKGILVLMVEIGFEIWDWMWGWDEERRNERYNNKLWEGEDGGGGVRLVERVWW